MIPVGDRKLIETRLTALIDQRLAGMSLRCHAGELHHLIDDNGEVLGKLSYRVAEPSLGLDEDCGCVGGVLYTDLNASLADDISKYLSMASYSSDVGSLVMDQRSTKVPGKELGTGLRIGFNFYPDQIDRLRQLIEMEAASAAAEVGLLCEIDSRPFVPPVGSVFGTFWYKTGETKRCKPTRGRTKWTPGVLQFTIYTPTELGQFHSSDICSNLKAAFGRFPLEHEGGFIAKDSTHLHELRNPHSGSYVTVVDATFSYYH